MRLISSALKRLVPLLAAYAVILVAVLAADVGLFRALWMSMALGLASNFAASYNAVKAEQREAAPRRETAGEHPPGPATHRSSPAWTGQDARPEPPVPSAAATTLWRLARAALTTVLGWALLLVTFGYGLFWVYARWWF